MNRNLITQIKNEWRDNLWLVIELTIVSVAVWYLAYTLSQTLKPIFDNKGFNVEDVYRFRIKEISPESPYYVKNDNDAQNAADRRTLIRRIRRSPYVEAASFSDNALPYQYSYMQYELDVIGSQDSVKYAGNVRMASPDIVRVIRPESCEGISPEHMESQLRKGSIYISPDDGFYSRLRDINSLLGKKVLLSGDSAYPKKIAGFIKPIRRSEYEYGKGTILYAIDENDDEILNQMSEIAVRVKPGLQKKFEEESLSDPDMRRMRNVYVTDMISMDTVRTYSQYSKDTDVRRIVFGIAFLLVIIFLGLLGTFWFRIRQRRGEIALRKTCGATSADIFRRITGEGLLLLAVATVPAVVIECLIYFKILASGNPDYYKWFGISSLAITLALMCIIIILGIMFPARKAMKIEPASALKEE